MSDFLKSSYATEFLKDFLRAPSWSEAGQGARQVELVKSKPTPHHDVEMNRLNGRDDDYLADRKMDLWATWWLLTEPGMDDIYEKSGDYLDTWLEEKELAVVRIDDTDYIFLARFEWRNYGKKFVHKDGVVPKQKEDDVVMFIDFLSGLAWDAIELLTSARDSSMTDEQFDVIKANNDAAACMPKDIFGGYESRFIYWNYLWMTPKDTETYSENHATNLKDTAEPQNLHDWFRVNVLMDDKFPIPGEFVGLGVRIFPEYPWGDQGSNPFIFSGNFMDTAFLMRGQITEVQDPTDTRPYKLYTVKTHLNKGAEFTICATDFEDYQVDDFVTIIKDVAAVESKDVYNWEDLEKEITPDVDKWMILPTTYYDIDEANQNG